MTRKELEVVLDELLEERMTLCALEEEHRALVAARRTSGQPRFFMDPELDVSRSRVADLRELILNEAKP